MTQLDTKVVPVSSPPEAAACIDAITRAFFHDPAARWTWPDPNVYEDVFPDFVRAFGGTAFAHSTAYFADDHAGAALWLPPGEHPDDEALGALLERTVPADRLPEVFGVFEQMAAFHPREPHWHLPLIGVRPQRQGKGLGAALLAPILERCDRQGAAAYLEATTPRNAKLYQRLGFEPVAAIPCGSATVIVPMVRMPQ